MYVCITSLRYLGPSPRAVAQWIHMLRPAPSCYHDGVDDYYCSSATTTASTMTTTTATTTTTPATPAHTPTPTPPSTAAAAAASSTTTTVLLILRRPIAVEVRVLAPARIQTTSRRRSRTYTCDRSRWHRRSCCCSHRWHFQHDIFSVGLE